MARTVFKVDTGLSVRGNSSFYSPVYVYSPLTSNSTFSIDGIITSKSGIDANNIHVSGGITANGTNINIGSLTGRFNLYANNINIDGDLVPNASGKSLGNTSNRWLTFSTRVDVSDRINVGTATINSTFYSATANNADTVYGITDNGFIVRTGSGTGRAASLKSGNGINIVPDANTDPTFSINAKDGLKSNSEGLFVDLDTVAVGTIGIEHGGTGANTRLDAEKNILPIQDSATAGKFLQSDGISSSWSVGVTGYTGSRGFTGSSGAFGGMGYTGSQGYVGSIGPIGFTGSRGPIGYTGSESTVAGPIGFTGSRGFTGSQGIQGPIGFTGTRGFTGSQGIQGNLGYTGSQGIQGVGFTGSRGFTGSIGPIGYTGSQGYVGSIGPIGLTGSQGIQGPIGIGYTGSQGTRGIDGARGYTGSQSTVPGYTGSQGVMGNLGHKGDIGYTGSQSTVPGYTGSRGTNGAIGFTGSAGESRIPATQSPTGSLSRDDVGKALYNNNYATLTIPTGVFEIGDVVTIINHGRGGPVSIAPAAGFTLFLAGTTSTGNRNLAINGVCSIWFGGPSNGWISGSGIG